MKVPTDIFAVKAIGLDSWQADFFWGVSDQEYFELSDALLEAFDLLYEGLDEKDRDLLLSDIRFFVFLCQHVHALVNEGRCATGGIDLIPGPLAASFYSPDWDSLSRQLVWSALWRDRLSFQFRRTAKRLRFNKNTPLLRRIHDLFKPQEVWSLGSLTRLKSEFVKSKGITCDHPYVQTFLTASSSSRGEDLSKKLVSGLREFSEKVQVHLAKMVEVPFASGSFLECWARRLRSLLSFSACLRATDDIPKILLLSELGNPFHRLIALQLRQKGTRIIGFHHGNDMGNAWEKFSGYMEAAVCNEFVCPTAAAARFHEKEYHLSGISRFCPVKFSSVETSHYLKVYEECRKLPFPREIKTVMVMGYPMNAARYLYSAADFFLFQLDVELRVVKLLKENGYTVIYKMHPERWREATGIFEGLCDAVSVEPFEKVWHQGDAFFFGCTTSTTFGFALCTNRPVFLLDMEGRNWNPEAYDLLKRRCKMIPSRFREGNRIEFDRTLLLQGLARTRADTEGLDDAYVMKCMFPRELDSTPRVASSGLCS